VLEHADEPEPPAPGLPHGAAAVLSAASDELSPLVRSVGWASAVVGEALEIQLVAATANVLEADAVAAVDELVRRGLIRAVAGTGRFAFRDRAVWRAAYASADPAWRVAAHARAAEALRGRGASAASLAPHLEFAATMGDLDAISVLADAARSARPAAPSVAARWLRAAIRLLPQHEHAAPRRTRLLVDLADALADAGRLPESRELLHRALESVERDAPDLRGFVTARCAQIERLLCHREEGRALLLRALSARPGADDDAVPLYAFELAVAELGDGELGDSRRWAGVALSRADRRGIRTLKAAAHGLAGLVESLGNNVEGAAEMVDVCARLVDGLTDSEVRRMPQAAGLLGWGELLLGRRADALRHLERAIAAARAAGNALALPELLVGRSIVLRDLGRLLESADAALSAVELAAASGSDQLLVLSLAARCWVATWVGDQKLAMHTGAASTAPRGRPAGRWVLAHAHRIHAEARLAAGHADAGADLLGALGGPALAGLDPWSRVDAYELLTRVAIAADDPEAAHDWAARAESAAADYRAGSGSPG
jgi:tetratricopeptide (TPR) repeat protein